VLDNGLTLNYFV